MPKVKSNVKTDTTIIDINTNTTVLNDITDTTVVKQKRGRKTKKQMEEMKQNISCTINEAITNNTTINDTNSNDTNSNDTNNNNDTNSNDTNSNDTNINDTINEILTNNNDSENEFNAILNDDVKGVIKKRGRKPKGGKIIQQIIPTNMNKETKSNIILHLKCSLKDLINNSTINSNIESFDFSSCKNDLLYEINVKKENNFEFSENITNNKIMEEDIYYENNANSDPNIKEIWRKLKQLEYNLHINNISNKKSYCFWCTCDFDNPPVYIPKHYIKETYHVYGCFCSPECGTAFLMDENIDSSTKFERYHLLNHIYAKIYNYTNNIKPAPNPYYMLDKYYGNLNIQEYRALLNNQRLFLIVDKPMTRILPELHEDNDDFIINNKVIPSNTYQVKKNLQKKSLTKNNIVNEKFGFGQ
jgi:hypothetical protein